VAALAEPTIAMAMFARRARAGSTNLGQIVAAPGRPAEAVSPGYLLAFTALFIVTLARRGGCVDTRPRISS